MTNDLESTKDEIHIHTESSLENHRFSKYIGDSDLLIFKMVDLKINIVIRENLKLIFLKKMISYVYVLKLNCVHKTTLDAIEYDNADC